jgi:adenosylcobinamide-phosphate synthase
MNPVANVSILAGALLVEAAIGYPEPLFRAVRHPVVWIGSMLTRLEWHLNREDLTSWRRGLHGVLALFAMAGGAIVSALMVQMIVPWWLAAVAASSLFAQRSLCEHVRTVGGALERGGLAAGRAAVAHIVGRNPETLDEPAVLRAAIESLAENFSDGVVAPAFWCLLFGLPGVAAYKAVNTADSMIGHRTLRHAAFGWGAARLDDVVNLPASRLAAVWLVLAAALHPGASALGALQVVWRDARKHRSPNAGWPEAAMAGGLGLSLAGPRTYGSTRVEDAWMGNGRPDPTLRDLRRALTLYRIACGIEIAAVLAALLIVRG